MLSHATRRQALGITVIYYCFTVNYQAIRALFAYM